MKLSIKAEVSVNANVMDSRDTALHSAVQNGQINVACQLIKAGDDVNQKGSGGDTPLLTAVDAGQQCVSFLLESRADVNVYNSHSETALMRAVEKQRKKHMELLIKSGACVDATDQFGRTLLMRAAFRYSAKITVRDKVGQNAIIINVVMSNSKQNFRGRHRKERFGESKIDKATLLLLAAGEILQVTELRKHSPRGGVTRTEVLFCLKHLCTEAIRNHLITLDPHSHLFHRILRLRLPSRLSSCLLYGMILSGDIPPNTLPKVTQLPSGYKFT